MAFENRNGSIELDFADGTYVFRLAIGELEELQEKTAVGPYALLRRLLSNDWRIEDVIHVIRLGLIGGGKTAEEARNLTRRYVEQRPNWMSNAMVAQAVVSAALVGAPEEAPGKSDAPKDESEASNFQTDALSSVSFTEPQAPLE